MKRWAEIIKGEWELAAFICCLTVFCLMLLFRILGGEPGQQTMRRGAVKHRLSLITPVSFAFLDMPDVVEVEQDSPFFKSLVARRDRPWARILAEIRNPRRPRRTAAATSGKPSTGTADTKPAKKPKPSSGTSEAPVVAETPAPKPEEKPKPPAPDPEAERRRLEAERQRLLAATRIVTYLGSATTGSGVQAAYVQVQNAATKEKHLRFLTRDQTLGDVRVVGFDADALEVAGADGSVQRIRFGTAAKIVLEP